MTIVEHLPVYTSLDWSHVMVECSCGWEGSGTWQVRPMAKDSFARHFDFVQRLAAKRETP